MDGRIGRRGFLAGAAASLVVAGCGRGSAAPGTTTTTAPTGTTTAAGPTTTASRSSVPRLGGDPFTLGVASGDPLADRVVIWTRLAPDPLGDGGMPAQDVEVTWEVAGDESFGDVVRDGVATARPAMGHSVHVDVDGLDPDRWYHYRFRVGDHESPVGRTRTFPVASASPSEVRFAFASCQHWEHGHYAAHGHLAAEDIDVVLFLGDYVYEGGAGTSGVRQHDGPTIRTLDAYRARYGLYKGDPSLQAAHAAAPWVVVWDDHEVVNNYAGETPRGEETTEDLLARRAAAYQAWYEHQPVRLGPPEGHVLPIHRSTSFGDLAAFFAIDTRQHRSVQACGYDADLGPECDEVRAEDRTLLGDEQEGWLLDGLGRSPARWNVVAQQVVMTATPVEVGDLRVLNMDQWDGYPAQRRRVLDGISERGVANPVVVTGDIHSSGVGDLRSDPGSPIVGTELVGTSISSMFPENLTDIFENAARAAPDVRWADARHRGYVRCTVTRDELRADYRLLDDARRPDAEVSTARSWVVEDGRPGAQEA